MTIAASYDALSRLLDYPAEREQLQTDYAVVSDFLNRHQVHSSIATFADFAASATDAELEEEYVASFDFNPATAPYLGHHLFGDNQKKGSYMIMLKQEYARCGYTPDALELPDHLSMLLGFLAHLARQVDTEERQQFIVKCVLPGVERYHAAFDTRHNSHWKVLVEAAMLLCTEDCKEVHSC